MSTRLSSGGHLIDRNELVEFEFNGKRLRGFRGDTLASALLANNQLLVGRSFKYHRPRGVVASGAEEPNALMNLGQSRRFEPNQRATTTEIYPELTAKSQNHWPTLSFDIGALNNLAARFLPAGFYYKTFMAPRAAWKHVFEPLIRRSAGLGQAPSEPDVDRYEHVYDHVDVLVVGGGIAGLEAARTAGQTGARVLLVEQASSLGGRASVDGPELGGTAAPEWIKSVTQDIEKKTNIRIMIRSMAAGVYDHGYVTIYQRVSDHLGPTDTARHRLWRVRAKQIITASGALERPLAFAGNDRPGVMLASAIRDYVVNYGVSPGDRTVVVTNNDDAYKTAFLMKEVGLDVPAIIDARMNIAGHVYDKAKELGIRVELGKAIAKVNGTKSVQSVSICAFAGEGAALEKIECDAVAMSGGWSPVVHLWSHCGGKLQWDENRAQFVPDLERPPRGAAGETMVLPAGSASGHHRTADVLADAAAAGRAAAKNAGARAPRTAKLPDVVEPEENPILPVWVMPQGAGPDLRAKMWLDFQNDVKVPDVELAAREGFESVEHTKRYTTLGMATDQGKLSNINGLAILSKALNNDIPNVGTTTFRPPYTPISMGSIAGEARKELFQPVRKTPIHDWHQANGADWEPVGQWRRPFCYLRPGETVDQAVAREVTNTRENVGLLDASTLGKILVKGPDAGAFLDLIYTNMMSTLPIGKCRYGLMCSENGFLIDDGVVARLDEDTWLCHTTTGGADSIHAHMEDWLQCEWWTLQVFTANVTEQFAQITVVGPKAREVLTTLGGMDLSAETLPFMQWAEGEIGGIRARVFRISFSGELSYEIAVPAGQGQAFWDMVYAAGADHGIMPYGTEALHVLRAEKGFIMIGEETDGTVIPQDLGLNWALSKKKQDYLGKRAHERAHMASPDRWRLVGLETLDGSVLPAGAYAVAPGTNANGQRNTCGRVTSSYHSPTLGRGIAMALVHNGPERMGDVLDVPLLDAARTVAKARIVDPVFYDKDGEKQNV